MAYTPPDNDAVNFSEEGSYSPPSNDAVNFSEGGGAQTLSAPVTTVNVSTPTPSIETIGVLTAPVTTVDITSPAPSIDATATLTPPTTDVQVLSPSPTLRQYETLSAPVTEVQVTSPSPSVQATGSATLSAPSTELRVLSTAPALEPVTAVLSAPSTTVAIETLAPSIGSQVWEIDSVPFEDVDGVELDAKTLTLSGVAARYRLRQLRQFRTAAEKVDVVVDDDGRFRAVDRSLNGNVYTVKPPVAEDPPQTTRDTLVADFSEQRAAKQEEKSEVEIVLQKPESRDPSGGEPSETASTGEWLFEFYSGAVATQRVRVEQERAIETAKDVERLSLVLTAEQVLVLATSAAYPDAVSIVEIPDGQNLAEDNSTDDRQTVEVTAPSAKEQALASGTYVVGGWSASRIDSDSYEVSLDLRPKA